VLALLIIGIPSTASAACVRRRLYRPRRAGVRLNAPRWRGLSRIGNSGGLRAMLVGPFEGRTGRQSKDFTRRKGWKSRSQTSWSYWQRCQQSLWRSQRRQPCSVKETAIARQSGTIETSPVPLHSARRPASRGCIRWPVLRIAGREVLNRREICHEAHSSGPNSGQDPTRPGWKKNCGKMGLPDAISEVADGGDFLESSASAVPVMCSFLTPKMKTPFLRQPQATRQSCRQLWTTFTLVLLRLRNSLRLTKSIGSGRPSGSAFQSLLGPQLPYDALLLRRRRTVLVHTLRLNDVDTVFSFAERGHAVTSSTRRTGQSGRETR